MTNAGAAATTQIRADAPHQPSMVSNRDLPLLSFQAVSKTFADGTVAILDVSFETYAGTIVSIVGPSGCGKSTLLRIASGLSPASSGEVQLDRASVGYVFQDATLLPWRTVRRNVELFAELHGLQKAERQRLGREAIALVGLEGFENHYPNALSGGMRMRASIARSLTMKPRAFLFDEPFGALDEISRQRLNEELLRVFLLEGFGGLLVTHSVYEAVYLSSRVLVMSARPGRIVADIPVPFPYPRAPDLRFQAAFAELAGAVSEVLRKAGE